MSLNGIEERNIVIVGEGRQAYSVTVCLLQSGHNVTLCTSDKEFAEESIATHCADIKENKGIRVSSELLNITDSLQDMSSCNMALIITAEDILKKKAAVAILEKILPMHTVIAVNSESIPLSDIQEGALNRDRIIGANWTEPAHTTFFLEIIANGQSNIAAAEYLAKQAKLHWRKDPYIIHDELGIRSKMLAAMTREAFYLVDNGYASIEDIDRACRNDPGYYLPFAGNFRYIDLMGGAMGYGRVMKDLNPELSTSGQIPRFFAQSVEKAGQPFQNNKGLYEYTEGSEKRWEEIFSQFSYQIEALINKYPFDYPKNKE